ncbi:MAG: M20/M25/M40 family metallo-hydrolase [Spirochaetales bacterium]|nr:M20/M25/M40 family metallo-hydrolase [Spirochaetales bacterium]
MSINDKQKEEILSFTSQLIRQSETSGREANTARCVAAKMEALGYDQVLADRYGSVIGIREGALPGPTLLLDAHMDIVPAGDEKEWHQKPFGGKVTEDRIWGRGSTDMKGALAAMIYAPAGLERREFRGRIIVSASVAEELMIGTALKEILSRYSPDAVIVGEPTSLKIGTCEKGRASVEMICRGTTAHSSRPDLGDNAVYRMMEAVRRIQNMPLRSHERLGKEIMEVVEISSLTSPGNGSIPDRCRALWECRLLPGETEASFLKRWKTALQGLDKTELSIAGYELPAYTGETLRMRDFLPGWEADESAGRLITVTEEGLKEQGIKPEYYAAPYGCNALASAAGFRIPTVILGPGDISLAHKPDEYIRTDELMDAAGIYRTICRNFLKA